MSDSSSHLRISAPNGVWHHPWPQAIELAALLPSSSWVLVGGLMVRAHALAHGIVMQRLTTDLDVLVDIEVATSVITVMDQAITSLGYQLQPPVDERRKSSVHFRYLRPRGPEVDCIDVMAADHARPHVSSLLRGRPMFRVEGGTQALKRRMTYLMELPAGASTFIAIPDELGALVLKGAAYIADSRMRGRHLEDAAVLACCLAHSANIVSRLGGSDRKRLRALAAVLRDTRHPAWAPLDEHIRHRGHAALQQLAGEGPRPRRP